jgi:F0F1-type ATP synthase epsilon subunit
MSNGETIPGQIKLTIITSTELIVDTQVKEVLIPGLEGELGILPGHRPLVWLWATAGSLSSRAA